MQNSPQNHWHVCIQLEMPSLVLLFALSMKQLWKDEHEKCSSAVSTLPSQTCFGATLQHWWKTTSLKHIALRKAGQHWRSQQTRCCASTQVSEDRHKHKRPKETRWGILVAKPCETCYLCTCWTNRQTPSFVLSGFFLGAPQPWPSG